MVQDTDIVAMEDQHKLYKSYQTVLIRAVTD